MAEQKTINFIDKRHIDQAFRLKREVSIPQMLQEKPVIMPGTTHGSILKENDDLFKAWYSYQGKSIKMNDSYEYVEIPATYQCYITSKDGVSWEHNDLSLPYNKDIREGDDAVKKTSVISPMQIDQNGKIFCGITGPAGFCVLDNTITPHPYARARYTALYLAHFESEKRGGLCFAYSDDGINWVAYPENPVIKGHQDTNNCFFFDRKSGKYVIYGRPTVFSKLGRGSNRFVGRSESEDMVNWSPYRTILDTDERDADPFYFLNELSLRNTWFEHYNRPDLFRYHDDGSRGRNRQFYGITVYPYYDMYIGLAQVIDILTGETWQELVHSYDNINWEREAVPIPFIAPRKGHWDSGMTHIPAASPPVPVNDKIYFYYTGSPYNHHQARLELGPTGVGIRFIEKDRYIGYRASDYYGELITVPIKKPDSIYINASIGMNGDLSAEIIGPYGEEIESFEAGSCYIRQKDDLYAELINKNSMTLASIPHKNIRIRFRLKNASIFGMNLMYKKTVK